ncbi:hypothetical protein ABZT17_35125 [Streptomyces sp. NPDC005648]|uniref:hypothetical protein n=1 Tax=Streptomyces sp. NPDC005648 TaxID=3157044 RepID=UPI00339DE3EF
MSAGRTHTTAPGSEAPRRCYHLPTDITVPDGLPARDAQALRELIVAAVRAAVRDTAPGGTPAPAADSRPEPRERVGQDRATPPEAAGTRLARPAPVSGLRTPEPDPENL